MRVAVMTDTNSGISVEEGKKLGVHVIPMPVLIDGQTYYEGVNLAHDEFYRFMLEGRDVSTSQPSPGDVLDMWDGILETHDALVHIPMSSGLSTTYQTALALAADYGGRVQVADHRSVSVPQRYAVLDALKMAAEGWSAEKIKLTLESAAQDTIIYIGVETLEFLKKGGRITPAAARMGTVLQIKPILQIRGERLDAYAKVRGTKHSKRRVIEAVKARAAEYERNGEPFVIAAAGSFLKKAEETEWIRMAQEAFPGRAIHYDPLAFSIGCHVGPGAFGMAVSKRAPAGNGPTDGKAADGLLP
nr:DegV family protein [uncultured Oscillibacter sp.]